MFKGLLFFIKSGWKYDKYYILWNIFHQLVNAPVPLLTALFPKLIIDELMYDQRVDRLLVYVILLAGALLVAGVLSTFFLRDGFSRRCKVDAEFGSSLHKTLYKCDYGNLESPKFLEMQEKAKKFLYCNQHGFGYLLDCALNIFGHCITLLGIAAIISSLNMWLILLFILLTTVGAIIEHNVQKKIKNMTDSMITDQRKWTYYANLFEKEEYGKEFRLYNAGEWLLRKERDFFTRTNNTIRKQNNEFIKSGIATALFTFLEQCAAYGYLIFSVLNGSISIGSFMMYISAVTAFAASFRQIINAIVEIRAYDMYYENLDEYLSVPSTLRSGTTKISVHKPHTIEFVNVSFKYPGGEHYTLKNINLTIRPGEKLLIVGENGAGKTTFIKLLLRLYDPTDGEILLDGINIKAIDYDDYTALFATVFQDYHLLSFSLRDNVSMSATADDANIAHILHTVGLDYKLHQLKNGLDTSIHKDFDENGFEPSGGEGQKIAIARALYKNAPIVILDEPTAALDPRAEFDIYQQFNDMVSGKTAVYISHRLSSARFCDIVAVFENGTVTEYGSHKALLAQSGKYAELFNMQADFYIS